MALSPSFVTALRLTPGDDLKEGLLNFVKASPSITSAWIQTCVGSLDGANIRLANATATNKNEVLTMNERFEILGLVGTIDANGAAAHLHITLGDKNGKVYGGHVMAGCKVFTTAEIVLGTSPAITFGRAFDAATGFPELLITQTPPTSTPTPTPTPASHS
eukprot:m.45267 g.45267  ORF g.45267 m.45267 type:complete len:161 (-) comp19923_c0_seq1:148-630(-)